MNTTNETPIWEDMVAPTPQRSAYGRRIYRDGRFLEYSNTRIIIDAKKMKTLTEPRPLDWYLMTTLSPDRVRQLEDLLEQSGFFSWPAAIDLDGKAFDTTTWTLSAHLPGKEHTVRVLKYPANQPAAVVKLVDGMVQLTAP